MGYRFPDSVLLVFCKAPISGQVKTRLQPELTTEQALAAHIALTRMTLDRAVQAGLCPLELCCAPNTDHEFFQSCAKEYPLTLVAQRGSDLGVRMHHAFTEALTHARHAVLIGCDCPSLKAEDLQQAFTALHNQNDLVIAPAEDGGYVLIGLNAPQPQLFLNMHWSVQTVMAQTRRRAEELGLSVHTLPMQWDVDTLADWMRYLRADQIMN